MSKNSKVAQKLQRAREFKRAEMVGANAESNGNKGPAKTKKLNKKVNTWWTKKDGKATPAKPKNADDSDE